MFKAQFSFSSTIFIKDIKIFFYFTSISNEKTITSCKIIKTIYKVKLNKALKINKITNRILRQFINVATKQLQFFFNKYVQKNI